MARPKKQPDEQRSERLPGIRLTAAERAYVEDMAARAGLDISDFCRRAILGQRVPAPARKMDAAAIVALNRVGVNLNQIAARVNFSGDLADDFRAVLIEVRAAVQKVADGGS